MPEETAPVGFNAGFDAANAAAVAEHAAPPAEPKGDTKADPAPAEEQVQADAQPPDAADPLLNDEAFDRLKEDPVALRKALHRSYTQKTQAISQYRKLIEAFESDPQATLKQLATHYGMTIAEAKAAVAEANGDGDQASETVEALKKQLIAINPELEVLADALGPVIEQAAARIAGEKMKPLEDEQQAQKLEVAGRAAEAETKSALEAFDAKRPEWRKHEKAMLKIAAERYEPKNGTSYTDYLEDLYVLATRDTGVADEAAKQIAKITASARASEPKDSGVSATKVVPSKPKGLSFDRAFDAALDAAKRGEVWAD